MVTENSAASRSPESPELPLGEGRLYGAFDNVTLGIRARELAVSLHGPTVVPVPKNVSGTGVSMTLLQALEQTREPRSVIHAYWQTAFHTACYHVRQQEQAWMDGLSRQMSQYLASGGDPTTPGYDPGSLLRLNLAKQIAAAELVESQIRLWESQFRLTMVLGLPENAAWPIAVTVPHCGPFETYADRQPESIVGTPLGQQLVEVIPGRYEYLTTLATAVVTADATRSEAMSAVLQAPGSMDAATDAIRQQSAASEVFLEALFGYNRAIADYVSLIYTSPVSAQQWVQTLVVTGDGTDGPKGQGGTEGKTGGETEGTR